MPGSPGRAQGAPARHGLLLREDRTPAAPQAPASPQTTGQRREPAAPARHAPRSGPAPAVPPPAGGSAAERGPPPAPRSTSGVAPCSSGAGGEGGSAAGPAPAEGPGLLPHGVWRLPAPGALASGSVWRRRRGEPARRSSSLRPCSVSSSTTPSWGPKRERYRRGGGRGGHGTSGPGRRRAPRRLSGLCGPSRGLGPRGGPERSGAGRAGAAAVRAAGTGAVPIVCGGAAGSCSRLLRSEKDR